MPILMAVNLTYPEKVSRYNIEKLRQRIINGEKYPGANFLVDSCGNKMQVVCGILSPFLTFFGFAMVADCLMEHD